MIGDLLYYELQISDDLSISVMRIIISVLSLLPLYFLYRILLKYGARFIRQEEGDVFEKKLIAIFKYFWIFSSLFALAYGLKLADFSLLGWIVDKFHIEWDITQEGFQVFKIGSIILGLLIIQLARLLDLILTRVLEKSIQQKKEFTRVRKNITEEEAQRKTNLTVQYTVYGLAVMLLLNIFNLDATLISQSGDGDRPGFVLRVSDIIQIIVILLLARLIISVFINVFLRRVYRSKQIDGGRQYSFNQLFSYFIYIAAVLFAFRSLGYNMTIIFGGLAALLVGIGLGLQQTFNDFFSGLILLFERSIEVGNVIRLEDEYGQVEKIGMRTSMVRDRDNIMRIIPNSRIVNGVIVNLTHGDNKSRFNVEIGVAYDTDLHLLEKIMIKVATEHDDVLPYPQPKVVFNSISASTFNVRLYYWTNRYMSLRMLESDLRWAIIEQARRYDVEVAYEQLDVRFRNKIIADRGDQEGFRITPLSSDRDFSFMKKEKDWLSEDENGEEKEDTQNQ